MAYLHSTTFEYLKSTDEQIDRMAVLRKATKEYADLIDNSLDDGPDKTYALRKLREVGMWVNVAVTRYADGAPRNDE